MVGLVHASRRALFLFYMYLPSSHLLEELVKTNKSSLTIYKHTIDYYIL